MRILAATMTGLFLFAAAVQWNDPDPLRWIALYGLAALLSVGVALGRSWTRLEWGATALFAAVVLLLSPAALDGRVESFTSMEMKSVADERVRELGGMLICFVWSAAVVLWRRQHRRAPLSAEVPAQGDRE